MQNVRYLCTSMKNARTRRRLRMRCGDGESYIRCNFFSSPLFCQLLFCCCSNAKSAQKIIYERLQPTFACCARVAGVARQGGKASGSPCLKMGSRSWHLREVSAREGTHDRYRWAHHHPPSPAWHLRQDSCRLPSHLVHAFRALLSLLGASPICDARLASADS